MEDSQPVLPGCPRLWLEVCFSMSGSSSAAFSYCIDVAKGHSNGGSCGLERRSTEKTDPKQGQKGNWLVMVPPLTCSHTIKYQSFFSPPFLFFLLFSIFAGLICVLPVCSPYSYYIYLDTSKHFSAWMCINFTVTHREDNRLSSSSSSSSSSLC